MCYDESVSVLTIPFHSLTLLFRDGEGGSFSVNLSNPAII